MDEPARVGDLSGLVERVPVGWTRAWYDGAAWGLRRTDRAGGRSVTLHAEQLGGRGLVSANVWMTADGPVLRPCEMAPDVVLDFLAGWTENPRPS